MPWTYAFDHDHGGGVDLPALLGGKGAGLAVMTRELGLPVPPGFTITTEACRAYLAHGWPDGLDDELRAQMARVERVVGRRFGDAADPLLVSVRSGAPVSMPGMLDTILNLGVNGDALSGLSRVAGPAFASACHERLGSMYRHIVGVEVPDDPWQQVRGAVEAVFRSWHSDRARAYRERERIPDDLGTAVTVQCMVFGNRGPDSATGVIFTRDPATGEDRLFGDLLFGAQGEDVVNGRHGTEPVAVLDERLPAVAAELRAYARRLETYHRDVCDIEFTIEEGRLWMLQNRIGKRTALAACRIAVEMAEDPEFPLTREEAVRRVAPILADPPMLTLERTGAAEVLATGLGASPGLVSGSIATTPEAAVRMAAAGTAVLLVRTETSPDDVHGMARSAGILTSTGGLACHAAVVARGWDIPAVVGARSVRVTDGHVSIGGRTFREGEVLSIDGSTGQVFGGPIDGTRSISPEAATLLAWATELGIEIPVKGQEVSAMRAPDDRIGDGAGVAGGATGDEGIPVGTEDVARAMLIKGHVTPETLASALDVDPAQAEALLERLGGEGLSVSSGGMSSLSDAGRDLGARLLAADREAWGADASAAALDGFLELDGRMKVIVTAWQMREVDGEQVLNDHADAEYDARVLADLAALHADASAWLAPLIGALPRLGSYQRRLDAAASAVAAGDGRYVASPRVDSYHGVWFELHEDLIRLAGRTREEEVAAGRA